MIHTSPISKLYRRMQGGEEGGGLAPEGVPTPGGRLLRRLSRRRSKRTVGSSTSLTLEEAAAEASSFGQGLEKSDSMGDSKKSVDSWYRDAMLQGAGGDISALLGKNGEAPASVPSEEDEVLEQYRMMAHVEANIRVKDNTGFDPTEYEKKREMQPEIETEYYSGRNKPPMKLPEPRVIGGRSGLPRVAEPSLPPTRANLRFVTHKGPQVPELSIGVLLRGQTQVPDGEHIVRCLGCKTKLKVSILATLVRCPDCSTVSPSSSTRR